MPKCIESRFLQKNSGNFKQFFVLVAFYEGRLNLEKSSHVSFVFTTYSTFDWSVKMRFWRSPVIGHEQNSAKKFDSYLPYSNYLRIHMRILCKHASYRKLYNATLFLL